MVLGIPDQDTRMPVPDRHPGMRTSCDEDEL
jgi:hypothetical protein